MKPRWQVNDNDKRGDALVRRSAPHSQKTDCNYQTTLFGQFSGEHAGEWETSFLNISQDYFRSEARWSYVAEVFFFALIIATTSTAIIYGARVVIHFLGLPPAA
jgi:hypothetical protein